MSLGWPIVKEASLMNNRRAALWMIGAIISFTSMAVAGRAISGQLDTFEIMLYRSIMGFGMVLAVAKFVGTLGEIDLKHFRLHLLRNIFHFPGQNQRNIRPDCLNA